MAATVYFIVNAGSIATVISLSERRPLTQILVDCYFWSFPYYLVGAGIAGAIALVQQFQLGNFAAARARGLSHLPLLPAIPGRLEDEKRHVEEMADLHLRTIEALALAIEAKDHTTHDHLQRVRVYAIELGKELGLNGSRTGGAAGRLLLHDIGKLAVPEHIISKPGKLTPEEFEKMKIHPVVGAEILERVQFPIRWCRSCARTTKSGTARAIRMGLKGEEIPIGARILSAVDCLDALASDRQYRRACRSTKPCEAWFAEAGKRSIRGWSIS